jgi:predicted Zn-dependent protease
VFRYGLTRVLILVFICTALSIVLLTLVGWHHLDLPVILLLCALTAGVVAIDLARTGRRVLSDFRQGRYGAARRGTRMLLRFAWRPRSRATLQLHLAACHLADGRYEEGRRALEAVDRELLGGGVRGIWENNHAYYLLCTGHDPREALAECDRAAAQDPGNPAFRSTRGIALLAIGYVEDAIAELQAAIDAGVRIQGSAAMAENYYHLARAWEAQGEIAYARDHYLKSVNTAPGTRFGIKSAERLQQHDLWPGGSFAA